jgi:hypothetical protein
MDKSMIAVAAIAAVLVITPLVAILLASFASLHEENARSLSGSAPGLLARLGRRMLGYHSDSQSVPRPAPRQPAGRQPQSLQIRVPVGV